MIASVIIPTYNGAEKLATLCHALQKQTCKDFELVILIDGSTDHTDLVIQDSFKNYFTDLKVVRQINRGRSAARNAGARAASGSFFIFYDDDMEPLPDSVHRHVSFQKRYNCIVSGMQQEVVSESNSDIENYKARLSTRWQGKYKEGLSQLELSNLFFTTANCSIPRDAFEKLGGFDEQLTDAEDFDFAYRAIEAGIYVFFDKSNKAVHHDRITCRSYIGRLRQYRMAHQKLQKLHPHRRVHPIDRSHLKRTVYYLLARPALVRLIDQGFFSFASRSWRYRLYDLVIHSLSVEFPERELK